MLLLTGPTGHAAMLSDDLTLNRVNPDHFSVRVKTPFPVIETVKSPAAQNARISIENYSDTLEAGMHNIPRKTIHVMIPSGKDLIMNATPKTRITAITLENDVEIADRQTHSPDEFRIKAPAAKPKIQYGDSLATIEDISYAGEVRIATISLWPIRYNSKTQRLEHTGDFEVQFAFSPDSKKTAVAPVSSTNNDFLAPVVLNDWDLPKNSTSNLDLIISHEEFRESLTPFIEFKKARGRDVKVLFISGQSANSVKEMIRKEYLSNPAPESTLIIGNIDQIPAWRGKGDNAWTDFPYQTLDAGDVPDIALGRVPAHNHEELSAFIEKAIARENTPPQGGDVLLTAGRDVSLGCPDNVSKVGDLIQSGDEQINLIKKFRSRGATQDEIFDSYNSGPNFIVYDGHGNHTGMTEIPLVLNNLSRLTNNSYPIVFDIACLNANWSRGASRRNFAEMILLKKDHGVAGIMASGGSGYGHTFFQTIGRLSAVARKDIWSGRDSSLNKVGTLILSAKIKHGSQDRSYWNYYGDPGTSVWPAP